MEQNTGTKRPAPNKLAMTSLLLGILGIFSWFYPPVQIILGSAASISAWLSRRDGRFQGAGIAGFIIGILCIVLSLFIFSQYMMVYSIAQDPANADLIRQVYDQAQQILNSIAPAAQ